LFFSYIHFKVRTEQNYAVETVLLYNTINELLWKIAIYNPKPVLSLGNLLRQSVMEVIGTVT